MQRLLIPLMAALALPTAINAETWYLLVKNAEPVRGTLSWTVPTTSEEECNRAKTRVVDKENWLAWRNINVETIAAICIQGK